jgi:rare lipoprotein A
MFKMRAKMISVGLLGAAAMLPVDLAKADQLGHASWYSLPANITANGEKMDPNELTAAHRSLPFGTRVLVENLTNGRSVVVRINDRGPFIGGRIIDLSKAAAESIGMIDAGTAKVRVVTTNEAEGGALAALGEAASQAKKGLAAAAPKSANAQAHDEAKSMATEVAAKLETVASLAPAKAKTVASRTHKAKSLASRTPAKRTIMASKASSKTRQLAKSRVQQEKVKLAAAEKRSHAAKHAAKLAAKASARMAAKSVGSKARLASSAKGIRAATKVASSGTVHVASAAHPYAMLGRTPGFMKPAPERRAS